MDPLLSRRALARFNAVLFMGKPSSQFPPSSTLSTLCLIMDLHLFQDHQLTDRETSSSCLHRNSSALSQPQHESLLVTD